MGGVGDHEDLTYIDGNRQTAVSEASFRKKSSSPVSK